MNRVGEGDGEDDERFCQRKVDEALEIKSLRRIISAYLNYPEASEEDIKRYERSFHKLPPAHKAMWPVFLKDAYAAVRNVARMIRKAYYLEGLHMLLDGLDSKLTELWKGLLSHYPLKFQRMRRCIATNTYFIYNMLQAFESPLDLSQDMDACDDPVPHDHFSAKRKELPHQSGSTCQDTCFDCCAISIQPSQGEGTNVMSQSSKEVKLNGLNVSCPESFPTSLEANKKNNECCSDRAAHPNGNIPLFHDWLFPSIQSHVPLADVDKVRCIIRNIVRDWATEGQRERDQCYKPILEELNSLFPHRNKESPPSCLVPGAGLGRLALEISCLGFASQGNEFSYYMMICSSFILNDTRTAEEWTIYPWIHGNCNLLSESDQIRPISVPDIHPASAGITQGFSMCGGDFVEVYNDPGQVGAWDAVVTCFFIDTAHNIVEYIEIISRILKDGGVWINLGPLLYHFADVYDQDNEMSIELSLEDVKLVALRYGFQLEMEKTIETTYTANPQSMMQNRYFAAFWTMRKVSTSVQ